MQELSPLAVILIALGLVVLINGFLLLTIARSSLRQQIRLLRRAASRAQDPWEAEQQALEELEQRVAQLQPGRDEPHE